MSILHQLHIYMYIYTHVLCRYTYIILGSSARSARAVGPCGPPGPCWLGPCGPLWVGPLWAPHGPISPWALCGPPWALVGWARMGPHGHLWAYLGPCGLGPCKTPGPLWAPPVLVGRALVGPLGSCGPGLCGPPGPLWAGPFWAPWSLMGPGPNGGSNQSSPTPYLQACSVH